MNHSMNPSRLEAHLLEMRVGHVKKENTKSILAAVKNLARFSHREPFIKNVFLLLAHIYLEVKKCDHFAVTTHW